MKYQTTAGRVVNRFGKSYKADEDGVILADSPEIAEIFVNCGFVSLEKVMETPKKKNAKI